MKISRTVFVALHFFALLSCLPENDGDCCYNIRLEYHFQRYGDKESNEIGYYIDSLREYIFNENEILAAVGEYRVPVGGKCFSEANLRQGKYTVVTFGNDRRPPVGWTIGQTSLQELEMTVDGALFRADDPAQNSRHNGDRLYFGYRNFTIAEYGVSRVAVDMTHAHCVLNVDVRWIDRSGHPYSGDNYNFTLRDVPSFCLFEPEFVVRNGLEGSLFLPEEQEWLSVDRRRINYIPTVGQDRLVDHAHRGNISNGVLHTELITFRYRSDSHVLLSVFRNSSRVMPEIDLYRFFRENGIDLNYSLCQEYHLSIEVNGKQVKVSLVNVDDWEDGGTI
jgi:hypothetical protein